MPVDPRLDGVAHTTSDPLARLAARIADLERQLTRLETREGKLPTGALVPLVAAVAPVGFLACAGQAVTVAYPVLREMLLDAGSPHGIAGSDPLLPNLQGRSVIGTGAGPGLTSRLLGAIGGVEAVTLDVTQIPPHDHGGVTGGAINYPNVNVYSAGGGTNFVFISWGGNFVGADAQKYNGMTHQHAIPSQGGGGSHSNMSPWVALPWMVKT